MSVILASLNALGSVPSLSISWKSFRTIGISSSLKADRIQQRNHQVLDFSILGDSIAASISFCVIDLFRWLIFFWFNF
jgi:hypothetical protein